VEREQIKNLLFLLVLLAAVLSPVIAEQAFAQESAAQILQKAIVLPPGIVIEADADVTRYFSSGKTLSAKWKIIRKTSETQDTLRIEIQSPGEFAGDYFLSTTTISGAERKTKRIYFDASKQKESELDAGDAGDSFAGTAFAFEDLDRVYSEQKDLQVLGRPVLDGVNCSLLDGVSPSNGKIHRRFWVRIEDPCLVRTVLYDKKERVVRSLKLSNMEKIHGIVMARKWEARESGEDPPTIVNISKIQVRQEGTGNSSTGKGAP
jgi:hypothetical protein